MANHTCYLDPTFLVGARWVDKLRRRPVLVRFGPALEFSERPAAEVIHAGIRRLLDHDPQPLDLTGLPREHLPRVLWQCPRCRRADGWRPARLAGEHCGAVWAPPPGDLLEGPDGLTTLGTRALTQRAGPWSPVAVMAEEEQEHSMCGPPRPRRPLGSALRHIDEHGLRFGSLQIAAATLRTLSTERADTLQVATAEGMWHFRPRGEPVLRLQ